MNNLFVYGTLKNAVVQKREIGRIITGEKDILKGYKKTTVNIGDNVYPIIVHDKESEVEGIVLSISDEELNKLDDYETSAYRRIKVKLKSGKKAWVYVK